MREVVAVHDLQCGMFVEELDRPWLGTPFAIEGFLAEDEEQLEQLRQICKFVHVDRSRSKGEQWREADLPKAPPRRAPVRKHLQWRVIEGTRRGPPGFLTILRHLREGTAEGRAAAGAGGLLTRLAGLLHSHEDDQPDAPPHLPRPKHEAEAPQEVYPVRSAVEAEMMAVAPAFQEAGAIVGSIMEDVQSGATPDFGQVAATVTTLVQSVLRNPDALMWLTRLQHHDAYAFSHALDVAVHLAVFGRFLELPVEKIEMLGTVGLMQDVGLVRLPPDLLHKAGPLTAAEKKVLAGHVRHSIRILRHDCKLSERAIETVARHHERVDGMGYPIGLKGDQIGLHGEMTGLVDTYCAMLSPRPYRSARSSQAALEKLNGLRNRKFSETVIDQFIQCIGLYPIGTLVELESGEVGLVIAQNRRRRLKPRLLLLLGRDKKPLAHPSTINLSRDPVMADGLPYSIRKALPPDAYGVDTREYFLA